MTAHDLFLRSYIHITANKYIGKVFTLDELKLKVITLPKNGSKVDYFLAICIAAKGAQVEISLQKSYESNFIPVIVFNTEDILFLSKLSLLK
jgi:hypothetical protein